MITVSPFDLPFLAIGDEWARRVVANGGAMPSGNTLRALATFRAGIASIKSQIVLCNFFAPDSNAAALTPLIVGPSPALWPITTPGYAAQTINGWQFGGVADPLITSIFTPSTSGLAFTNAGIVLYGYNIIDGITRGDFGAVHVATGDDFYFKTTAGAPSTQIGRVALAGSVSLNGYYSCQRTNSTSLNMYFANSTHAHASVGTTATAETGVISNLNFPAGMGYSIDGSQDLPTSRTYSFLAVTTGMSSADSATLYAAVQTLRTNLGGGFV
jgi:hypothetical protein